VKKAAEYRQHAQECRTLARTTRDETQRHQLLNMASTWDKLADERDWLFREHPDVDAMLTSREADKGN
jgi:hypothetical protein